MSEENEQSGPPGWLHDGKNFVQPASYDQAALFKRQGYIEIIRFAGCKAMRMTVVQRPPWRPNIPLGEKLPLPGEPGYPTSGKLASTS